MRRIWWVEAILGSVAIILLAWPLTGFVESSLSPYLGEITGRDIGGTTIVEDRVHGTLVTFAHVFALVFSFFTGGALVGRLAPEFPGTNGIASSAITAVSGFAWVAIPLAHSILRPINNPDDVYTRSGNLSNLLLVIAAFCVIFPLVFLAGYLGGRLGGRLRGRASASDLAD